MISSDNTNQGQEIPDNRQYSLDMAEAMQRLMENPDFKKVFSETYIDAYAITNIYNLWTYDDAARRRFLEKSLARSTFVKFIDDILEDGRQAKISMMEEVNEDTAEDDSY